MRAALVSYNTVVNIIEYDPDSDYTPPEEVRLVTLEENPQVGIGWTLQDDAFVEPPIRVLYSLPESIPADSNSPSVITYLDTNKDRPTSVRFNINGTFADVQLQGSYAQIEVVANVVEDIHVTVDDLSVTVTVTEV